MTEKDYLDAIEKIRKQIKKGNLNHVSARLDDLYEYKPVRLKWFLAKAEWMLASGYNVHEVFAFLDSKAWPLYNYPDIKSVFNLYSNMSEQCNDEAEAKRHKLIPILLEQKNLNDQNNFVKSIFDELSERRIEYLEKKEEKSLMSLMRNYFIIENDIMFLMCSVCLEYLKVEHESRESIQGIDNAGFIREVVENHEEIPCIIIADSDAQMEDCNVLVNILTCFSKKIYWIAPPCSYPVSSKIELSDTLAISMDNLETVENVTVIYPIELTFNGKSLGDNREYILTELTGNCIEKHLALLFSSGKLMDELGTRGELKKKIERMVGVQDAHKEDYMVFGWVGDYLSYIDLVHCMDTREAIDKKPEVEFSIVVPARNSSYSLKYTLLTCIDQRYNGSYEIILSDNSSEGNNEVYNLYLELNNPKIRYIRTPREQNLSKSFEYAFLHTRGEFILSIGSDDGVMPWTLEVISLIRKHFPDEDILEWERGFYAWPGFNGGQENQFVIPRKYKKDDCKFAYIGGKELLERAVNKVDEMYLLPMLYINSGFKRSYMKTLIEKTGRLWDGIGQDIYIGVVNAAIHSKILYIYYPLSIAGMTQSSEGAKGSSFRSSVEDENIVTHEMRKMGNISRFKLSYIEKRLPDVFTGISGLYNCILRAIARGVISESELESNMLLDWKKIYKDLIHSLSPQDIVFDRKLHYIRYTASLHGNEFLTWFDKEIYYKALKPTKIKSLQNQKNLSNKVYQEGKLESGGGVLDASKYGVTNILEAVQLFERLTGL